MRKGAQILNTQLDGFVTWIPCVLHAINHPDQEREPCQLPGILAQWPSPVVTPCPRQGLFCL